MANVLSDVIATTAAFEDLKKYLRQGSDFCRDVSLIINERVKLEQVYSENLSKLALRAKKTTGDTLGTMRTAWESFAGQMDKEAEIRKELANELLEQIVKPFKAFIDTQKEARKQEELIVEKAAKTYADKKSDLLKAKKISFKEAKESESLTVQLETIRGKTSNEKELSKLDTKCKKAEETVMKAEKDHIRKVIETERARLGLDSSLISSTSTLQAQEEERIGYVRNMLKACGEFMRDCVPKTIECLDHLNADVVKIDIDLDIKELIKTRGMERQPGEQIVFTCYEADSNSPMDEQRRKQALEQKYQFVQSALNAEKKARAGLAKLASVYQETPNFGGADTVDDVSTQIAHANAVIDCLDAGLYHINNSAAQLSGYATYNHRLADCIQIAKDKQNLPFVTLKVPFDRVVVGIPEEPEYQGLGPSQFTQHEFDSDEFDDIEDGKAASKTQAGLSTASPYAHAAVAFTDYSERPSQKGKCRAIYDYTAARDDELTLHVDDVINIIERSEEGWWTGECGGVTGVFPGNYVEEI